MLVKIRGSIAADFLYRDATSNRSAVARSRLELHAWVLMKAFPRERGRTVLQKAILLSSRHTLLVYWNIFLILAILYWR
ncbi:hypothetical protein NGR_c13580 [Sinorhizobium fredii NGR234]|uniref:Uncharacterized protein n=1 Tax=Sinorhizobium fredii (strain NBRC 101917 / NGR234) TaxID=394 RepID=C3MBS6_SINFN|nr:hypothetical protein NGR_c13580 [Sinorhizobium fredii NGR234]